MLFRRRRSRRVQMRVFLCLLRVRLCAYARWCAHVPITHLTGYSHIVCVYFGFFVLR